MTARGKVDKPNHHLSLAQTLGHFAAAMWGRRGRLASAGGGTLDLARWRGDVHPHHYHHQPVRSGLEVKENIRRKDSAPRLTGRDPNRIPCGPRGSEAMEEAPGKGKGKGYLGAVSAAGSLDLDQIPSAPRDGEVEKRKMAARAKKCAEGTLRQCTICNSEDQWRKMFATPVDEEAAGPSKTRRHSGRARRLIGAAGAPRKATIHPQVHGMLRGRAEHLGRGRGKAPGGEKDE